MNRGLQLDLSMGREGFDTLEATYRNEGLSVGADHMVSENHSKTTLITSHFLNDHSGYLVKKLD